jgi:hypothetical protein
MISNPHEMTRNQWRPTKMCDNLATLEKKMSGASRQGTKRSNSILAKKFHNLPDDTDDTGCQKLDLSVQLHPKLSNEIIVDNMGLLFNCGRLSLDSEWQESFGAKKWSPSATSGNA